MAERILVKEVTFNNGSTPVEEREVELTPDTKDQTGKFLYGVRAQMERGLYFYTRKGERARHGLIRPKRELRDIRAQYPSRDEMREVISSLKGEGKSVIVYKKEDQIVGFTLSGEKDK